MHKIKFVPIPKDKIPYDVYRQVEQTDEEGKTNRFSEMVSSRNTGERAIVRLRIPRQTVEDEEGKPVVQEIEYDDRALALSARTDSAPFSIFVINEACPRAHRKELVRYV